MMDKLRRGKHALEGTVGIDTTSASLAQDTELMRQLFGEEMTRTVEENFKMVDRVVGYPIVCPECGKVIDSYDSYADTRAEMRDHYAIKHPGKKNPYE